MVYFEFLCYEAVFLLYNAPYVWHENFKAISITHSECVSSLGYPACKAHAPYLSPVACLPVQYFSTFSH